MKNKQLSLISQSNNFRVVLVSTFVGLFVLAVFFLESYSSYKSEMLSAKIQSANLTQVLEEQISSSFKMIDLILLEIQDDFKNEKILSPKKAQTYNQWLQFRKTRLPEVLSFKVVEENGEFIGDDLGYLSKTNLRDRAYFQKLKASGKNELVISQPVISKTAHIWVVVLSRPLLGADGKFRGLVLATIPVDHYKKMFSVLNVGTHGVINFYGFDRFIYARKPWVESSFGKPVKMALPMENLINSNQISSSYSATSPVDNIHRILTARKLLNYAFVITVGLASEDVLLGWKVRTGIYFVFIILLFSSFGYFLSQFLKSLKLVEEQRKQVIQSAKLSSLGEMASGIAHEINNPLTIISGLALTSKRNNPQTDSDLKLNTTIDRIVVTVDRIAKIISGLRSFSRDSFEDPLISTSLKSILNSTLDFCREKLKYNNITLEIAPFEDCKIMAREIQVSQVLLNLLNNSLDALDGQPTKWIKIEVTQKTGFACIRVTDSGAPIQKAVAEKLMQPFFTTKSIGKGTGLGLSISRNIVAAHGGQFYYDQTSKHTSFVIELPLA